MLASTLEFYWVTGNEQNKLILPDHETCYLASNFLKRVGDGDIFEEC